MSVPISTSERVGVSIPATVSVYHNGIRVASVGINLLPPVIPIAPQVVDRVVVTEDARISEPGVALTVDATEVTNASAVFTVGFSPVVTFTREVSVNDQTGTREVVIA